MTVKYKTVITKAGAEKLAAATVPNGKKVNFTAMAVGDGGGTLPVPDAGQTALVNEVWRHGLNKISQDNKKLNYVIAELLIPPEAGGFWMREMGLYDDTGTLIAVGNMAESYKPLLEEGSGRAQTVRMVIMVSDIASVELSIDTSTVMATQEYVDEKLEEHEQSRRHPDATLTAKGFTQLSSATDSTSETLAATPKAVKTVYDLANGKYTAQDATTAQKGIVQLNSATDSASETLAATPKAVKTVSDDVTTLKNSLGEAAHRNVADSTSGELIPVGYKGIFKSNAYQGPIDFASYPFVVGESLFIDARYSTNNPPFLTQDYYYIHILCATGPAQGGRVNRPLIQFVNYSKSNQILAIREDDGATISWRYFRGVQFDTDNQTVTIPGEIKALNGGIRLTQNSVSIHGAGNKHLWFNDQNGKEMGLVYASDDKMLHLRAGEGPVININSVGNLDVPGAVSGASFYQTNPSGSSGWYGAGSFAEQYSNSAPFLIPLRYSTPKDVSIYLPLIKGLTQTDYYGYGSAVSFGILRSGKGEFGSAIIQVIGDNGSGAILGFNANGRLDVPSQVYSGGRVDAVGDISSSANIYSSGQISSGGNIVSGQGVFESGGLVRVYSSNNPPPQQDLSPYAKRDCITFVGLEANNSVAPYMRQESTGAIVYLAQRDWVNGNFATSSWTIANFLQGGLRLASLGVATNGNNDNEFAYAPNGTVVTAVQQKSNYTAIQYRSIQYNIGGNWYTAWVA
ncbi:TPA: phage tail protein [Enterobacter chengduensis]|uniref:phage tail protein n=1 Tax=Enterobacter TaxID=547 RepID=UPI000AF48289|nr:MULTISPECIES: phage tail protein [Enterobacter]MDV0368384.1 phage tail protein [Enterobacter chengduensis]MDY0424139.1 phage tail protein [Enterobacter sp. 170250]